MRERPKNMKRLIVLFLALLFLSPVLFAQGEDGVQWHYCEIESTELGKMKYRGENLDEAMLRVTRACVDRQHGHYERRGSSVPQDRAEIFIESCVNLVQCSKG